MLSVSSSALANGKSKTAGWRRSSTSEKREAGSGIFLPSRIASDLPENANTVAVCESVIRAMEA